MRRVCKAPGRHLPPVGRVRYSRRGPDLEVAAVEIHVSTLDQLLQSVSDVMFPDRMGEALVAIDTHGYDRDTALHVFAWRGDTPSARVLLGAGADPNARGEMDETPLHAAIRSGNAELVSLLIQHGADPDLRGEFGTGRELAAREEARIAQVVASRG